MNNYQIHLHNHIFQRELNELYASLAIRSFAISLISVFIPIYLLQNGYSLAWTVLFYAIFCFVHSVLVIPAAKLCGRIGIKHCMLVSVPLLISFYILLNFLSGQIWLLIITAFIMGIHQAVYWTAYHLDLSKITSKKKRGSQISKTIVVKSIFRSLGPIIGGIILTTIGFPFIFILVVILLFVSIIPLFLSEEIHTPKNFSFRGMLKGQTVKDAIAYVAYGWESGGAAILWPIFIFFSILQSYTALGFVTSLGLAISIIFTLIIGKYADLHKRLILKIGAFFNSLVWLVRLFVNTPLQVYFIDSVYGISQKTTIIPFDTLTYDKANKGSIVRHIIFREIFINGGRSIFFVIIAVIGNLTASFWIAAGVSLLYLLF